MTAANLVVRGAEAFLLTDAATLSQGIVVDLCSKVVATDNLRLAITHNGVVWPEMAPLMSRWMSDQVDEDAAIADLPVLSRRLRSSLEAAARSNAWADGDQPLSFNLFVAVWSPLRRRAEGYIVASHAGGFAQGVRADHAYQTGQFISPGVDRSFYPPVDQTWNPLPLIEAQRARVNRRGYRSAGGAAYLTTVSEAGTDTVMLRQWADEIGRPIFDDASRDAG